MTEQELRENILKALQITYDRKDLTEEDLTTRDEVIFEAGIKEVVEWMEEHSTMFLAGQDIATEAGNAIKGNISYYPIIKWLEWQAKLKSWGIK